MLRERSLMLCVLAAALLLPVGLTALAQAGYSLNWWTVDAGGGLITGSGYTLDATIGQPDAGSLAGGGYTLAGGFWLSDAAARRPCYLPLVLK